MRRICRPIPLYSQLAALAATASLAAGPADEAQASTPHGLYRGTIGGEAVTVCFGAPQGSRSYAEDGYYNEAIGKTVELTAVATPPGSGWMESEPSAMGADAERFSPDSAPYWTIDAASADELRGRRHVPESFPVRPGDLAGDFPAAEPAPVEGAAAVRVQPVQLVRESAGCDGYEAHRLDLARRPAGSETAGAVVVETTVHPLTGIVAATAIRGLSPEASARLSKQLADETRTLDADWFDCRDYEGGIESRFLSPRFLVFSVWTGGYCGPPHPDETRVPIVFRGASGEKIDLRRWLDSGSWDGERLAGPLRSALRRAMVAVEGDEVCAAHRDESGWSGIALWPDRDGVHFEVDESDRAFLPCENDYVLPFAVVRPHVDAASLSEFDDLVAETRRPAAR